VSRNLLSSKVSALVMAVFLAFTSTVFLIVIWAALSVFSNRALRPQSQTCQQPYSYTLFKVLVTDPQCLVGLQLNKAA
jgi:hypothetical protein